MQSVLAGVIALAGAVGLGAQSPAATDTLADARRLRDAGEFAAAATLLRPYVRSHPEDPGSARFAALMAYWAKDVKGADSVYADALARHPGDAELRLEYGRLLVDTRSDARAYAVLAPLVGGTDSTTATATARAHALVGTLEYWNGDYVGARNHFTDALRADSSLVDARRQLREIETAAATWVRVGAAGWDDDQPLQRTTIAAEGGWFANPLTPLSVRVRMIRFDADPLAETVSIAEAGLSTYLPRARLEVNVGGGVVHRSFGEGGDWTGRATLGIRAVGSGLLQVGVERQPYVNTAGSLATPIMTNSIEGLARWRPRGWWIEGVASREHYPDDNDVTTGYVWALAPLVRRDKAAMHAGYSFAAQAATTGRFIPRQANLSFPPGQAPATVPGKYDPYYTPRNLRIHSALASVRLVPNARWTLTSDIAYALHARDEAPVLVVFPDPPDVDIVRAFFAREFTPWNVRGATEVALTESARLGLTIEHGRRAYYRFTTFGVSGTYTFVAAARRRADHR
jgi:Tfp pilus assembly protein PilF